jgi:hypothetical protein
MPNTDRPAHELRQVLADAGFNPEEARAWSELMPPLSLTAALSGARAWQSAGIPTDDAVRWHEAGWRPEETASWWLLGFTPAQATFVRRRLQASAPPPVDDQGPTQLFDEWLTSGLSADDIVLCLATGHLTLDSALAVANAMADDPTLRGTLRLQADVALASTNLTALDRSTR